MVLNVAVLRECLRNNWHGQEELNVTFKHVSNAKFYFYDENPEDGHDCYDVSEIFHDRSIKFIKEQKTIVTTEEASLLATLRYLAQRNTVLEEICELPKAYIVRSHWAGDTLLQLGIDGEKIYYIPFAVDIERFHPQKAERKYSFPVFLYAGSLSYSKGAETLLDRFRRYHASNDKSTLLIIMGQFNNTPELVEKARTMPSTYIIPWSDKIENVYSQSDIYIQPQISDMPLEGGILSVGYPMLQALACGLPIISLDQGVARDYVETNKNGILCRKKEDILKAMSEMGQQEEIVLEYGRMSRRYAEQHFSPIRISEQYREMYKRIW